MHSSKKDLYRAINELARSERAELRAEREAKAARRRADRRAVRALKRGDYAQR